jgi:hypothetical protein
VGRYSKAVIMPVPSFDPDQRDPAEVTATDDYRPADPVWVFRRGAWRAGVVDVASPRAAIVTYRPTDARGTGVDTVMARDIVHRTDLDPHLDRMRAGSPN